MSSMTRDNPFDTILRALPTSSDPSRLRSLAQGQGYQVNGDVASRTTGYDIRDMASSFFGGPQMDNRGVSTFDTNKPSTFLEQAGQTLKWEYGQKQAAADRQFQRNDVENSAMRSFIAGAGGEIRGVGDKGVGELSGLISALDSHSGDSLNSAQKYANGMVDITDLAASKFKSGVDAQVAQGQSDLRGAADKAVATANSAAAGYNTGVTENAIQATVGGIRAGYQNQKSMIEKGLNPDGTLMTQAERMSATRKLQYDTGLQISQVVAQTREQAQKTLADLKMNVAGVELSAGGLKGQAATLGLQGEQAKFGAEQARASVRGEALQGTLAAQAEYRQFQSLIGSLTEARANMRSASATAALQFEMGGRQYLADAVRQNPETIIGLLSGLMSLATVASSPGGRTMPALNF